MLRRCSNIFVILVQRYLPDPFLFAIILTFFVFVSGIVFTGQDPLRMIVHWNNGFWELLAFSMQMCMVLLTGHALANAPLFKRFLNSMAGVAHTPSQAIALVTFVSCIACWVNWGFGLVISALFAMALARRIRGVDYRLLIASAYSGFLLWHSGLSGSIPLKVATPGQDLSLLTGGVLTIPIPTACTIFAPFNLVIVLVLLLTLPLINKAMHPEADGTVPVDPDMLVENTDLHHASRENLTPADRMENSCVLSCLISIPGIVYILYHFTKSGLSLNLNIVNFIFLFLGILMHGTPRRYLNAVEKAVKGTCGIMLQFPFYAGIMGMMTGAGSEGVSLAGIISNFFVDISTITTFPLFSFLSAGIVNFFVPSGGGQWAVQAPIMMPAGTAIGVPAAKTAMAIAWGDAWTNMIQPFWALPALGIAGLGARDIMGFCVMDLVYSGIIIAIGLMFI